MNFKCVQEVKDEIAAIASDPFRCSNATVVHSSFKFTKVKGKKRGVAFTQLGGYLISSFSRTNISVPRLVAKIQHVLNIYYSLTKLVERNSDAIKAFISEEFEFPPLNFLTVPSPPHSHSPLKQSRAEITCSSVVTTPVKTRRDCANCSSMKKVNVSLGKILKAEKSKHHQLMTFTANVKRKLDIKGQKQKLSRKEEKISEQKKTIRNLEIKLQSLERKSSKFHHLNENQSKDLRHLQCENNALKKELAMLKEAAKREKQELSECQRYCDYLELKVRDELDRSDSVVLLSKDGKAYSTEVRTMVYNQLVCDVPVKHCGHLISVFAQVMCGKKLKDTPSPTTCAQMAYELGVITTIQVMEYLLSQNENICLSWDATTIEGCHVNEVHLTVNRTNCLALDVRHLPGGKTSDYVTHIVSALTEAADVYGRYTKQTPAEIFTALKSSITSTLTDRAAVNACVTRQLRDELDTQLIQLNCNIHPLDSIARESKQNLVKVDEKYGIKGSCYGSEGTAANLINAVSVLRFKDGTGDPVGFKNMLRHNNLPVGTFVRYVGNRIHVLFHLAGILVLHWSKVKEFIQLQSTAGGLLRSRLHRDLSDEKIMAQVWTLGVMGKIFSGPWMSKFYSSAMSNLEMRPLVQSAERQLQTWIQMPQSLFLPTTNVFGEPLSPAQDDVLSALHSFVSEEVDIQVEALTVVLRACLTVLQRQLKDFLSEDELPPETRTMVSSAPTHNMASERTLGCLDKMLRRAPVATGGFLNGKVRSKMNKCTQWLDSQTSEIQEKLVSFAISEARQERVRRCVLDRMVEEEIGRRRGEVADERRQKNKNTALKSIKKTLKTKSVLELECNDSLKERISQFIEEPECLVGVGILHSVEQSEFYGRIQSVQPNNEIVVGYWGLEESESSSVDHTLSILSLFADAILGAVVFL